jgi:Domain of unknown function (DUF1840)
MLVRLNSSTSGELLMLAAHLKPLFEILGKDASARGVFVHEQFPAAIALLRAAVDEERRALEEARRLEKEALPEDGGEDSLAEEDREYQEDREERQFHDVHLGQRAYPLIRLMERTRDEGGYILWEADKDF